jgi:hypothetical protein
MWAASTPAPGQLPLPRQCTTATAPACRRQCAGRLLLLLLLIFLLVQCCSQLPCRKLTLVLLMTLLVLVCPAGAMLHRRSHMNQQEAQHYTSAWHINLQGPGSRPTPKHGTATSHHLNAYHTQLLLPPLWLLLCPCCASLLTSLSRCTPVTTMQGLLLPGALPSGALEALRHLLLLSHPARRGQGPACQCVQQWLVRHRLHCLLHFGRWACMAPLPSACAACAALCGRVSVQRMAAQLLAAAAAVAGGHPAAAGAGSSAALQQDVLHDAILAAAALSIDPLWWYLQGMSMARTCGTLDSAGTSLSPDQAKHPATLSRR